MECEGDFRILQRLARGDSRVGLLVLPGLMRGVVGSGLATALEKRGLANSLAALVGVSTGAPVVLYTAGGTVGHGTRIYAEQCATKDFISFHPKRVMQGTVVDVGFLCTVFRGDVGANAVDLERVRRCQTPLYMGATDYDTGAGVLIDAKPDPLQAVLASVAVPTLYRRPVYVGARRYVDGAIGIPFPAQAMVEKFSLDGLIVFANRSKEHRTPLSWRIAEAGLRTLFPPSLRQAIREREAQFVAGLTYTKRSGIDHLVVWSDDAVVSFTQDSVVLRDAAVRAERFMETLCVRAGL